MKKKIRYQIIFLIILSILFFIAIRVNSESEISEADAQYLSQYLDPDEINYVIANHLPIENLKRYVPYANFNVHDYEGYEKLRQSQAYTHLESINYFRHPDYYHFYHNPKPALFPDTPLMLVNKCFYVDEDYIPKNLISISFYGIDYIVREGEDILLKRDAAENYQQMAEDARKDNLYFTVFSGYRSYRKQSLLYYQVNKEDDTFSARPGFSEHQTGYALDISTRTIGITERFERTKIYEWLKDNCDKYGFILRYPKEKSHLTGYSFEPWHFRYVGKIASEIHQKELTLEEYLISNTEI